MLMAYLKSQDLQDLPRSELTPKLLWISVAGKIVEPLFEGYLLETPQPCFSY